MAMSRADANNAPSPQLGMNLGLMKDMMAIIAKYDREFPESDEIDLQNFSISENHGFLEMLPSKSTLWPDGDNEVTETVKEKDEDSSENLLSNTALDCFLEGIIAEETKLTEQNEDAEWEDVNTEPNGGAEWEDVNTDPNEGAEWEDVNTDPNEGAEWEDVNTEPNEGAEWEDVNSSLVEDEDQSLEVDSSDDTLSIASGTCAVMNSSGNTTEEEEVLCLEDDTDVEDCGGLVARCEEEAPEGGEEVEEEEERFEDDEVQGYQTVVNSRQSLNESGNDDAAAGHAGNQFRIDSRNLLNGGSAGEFEAAKLKSEIGFSKDASSSPEQANSSSQCESYQMLRVRTWLLGKRKRRPYEYDDDEGSPSKSSRRDEAIFSPRSPSQNKNGMMSPKGFQKADRIDNNESPIRNPVRRRIPESPSCRMLIESWKSQLSIHGNEIKDPHLSSPVTSPVTPKHRLTPRRHLVKGVSSCPTTSLPYSRRYHSGIPRELYKHQSGIDEPRFKQSQTFIVNEQRGRRDDENDSGMSSNKEEDDTASDDCSSRGGEESDYQLSELGRGGDYARWDKNLNITYFVNEGNTRRADNTPLDSLVYRGRGRHSLVYRGRGRHQKGWKKSKTDRDGRQRQNKKIHPQTEEQNRQRNILKTTRDGACKGRHLGRSIGEVDDISILTDPYQFEDSEILPETFTPKHNSTMMTKPLSVSLKGNADKCTILSGSLHSEMPRCKSVNRYNGRGMSSSPATDTTNLKVKGRTKSSQRWEIDNSGDEVESEMQERRVVHNEKPQKMDNLDKIPHSQSNCKKIFCLRCCHSPRKEV